MSVNYNETSYDTCPIYHYILGEAPGFGFRFFALFATGAAEDRILLLAATAVSSYEASTILEEPLGCCGKKLLGERKIEHTSMRGALDDQPPVSIHHDICRYIGVAGLHVAMWRGWRARLKDTERDKGGSARVGV